MIRPFCRRTPPFRAEIGRSWALDTPAGGAPEMEEGVIQARGAVLAGPRQRKVPSSFSSPQPHNDWLTPSRGDQRLPEVVESTGGAGRSTIS